ncbi:hypothetical protein B0919_14165 [Hymenobacter sp. CRA2]|nr:hypothetical protein B0919_14165 [Hymenobacter sp. CRA2]
MLGLIATSLLLYGGLFGFRSLAGPELDIQFHNTYFVVTPAHALGFIALLLGLLSGTIYLLLTRLPARAAAWVVGLAGLVLICLLSTAISAVSTAIGYWALPGEADHNLPASPEAGHVLPRLLTSLKGLQILLAAAVLFAGVKLARSYRLGK